MHCSANVGKTGDTALFFGLSGTGKTTLSSDPDRALIGDDEHGWGDDGVFNFEGGCYAKTINLREELEPLIWKATRHFGTILENVTIDQYSRAGSILTMTALLKILAQLIRLDFWIISSLDGRGKHPSNIFFLTADAFGVMPPISRLTPEQAIYYFLSGYTSKLAGTEKGIKEPQTTFSTCFGAPFLPLFPTVYANLLGEKIARHKVNVWLINTGWTGGAYGVGSRIRLPFTRAMIHAVLEGKLEGSPMRIDPFFGLAIPEQVPDVPAEVLNPRQTWANPDEYDHQARLLVGKFQENFSLFAGQVPVEVANSGPTMH